MESLTKCPYLYSCGGCDLLEKEYVDQLATKDAKTIKNFRKADLKPNEIRPILRADNQNAYRNKIQYNFDITYGGEIICGNYAPNSHHLISIDHCLLENELSYKIKTYFLQLMKDFDVLPYCNSQSNGSVKNLVIRTNHDSSEAMIIIITNSVFLPKSKLLATNLIKHLPEVKCIVHNVNPRHSGFILGPESSLLFGVPFIKDKLCGLSYHISPNSFFQINSAQTEKLYESLLQLTHLSKDDVLLDAYCGIGTIGLTAARKVKKVIGIEIVPEAVEDAAENATRNHLFNTSYHTGDVSKVIDRLTTKPTAVIVDPPRSGLSPRFVGYLNYNKPAKITYVSCNQKTLLRDLQMLKKNYLVDIVQPVDMFPNTGHIETIVTLKLKV